MRIAILTHYWTPEVGAPQTRLRESALELMRLGDDVRVITNHPHYPDGSVRPPYHALTARRETMDGIRVLRLPVLARPNNGFVNRVIDQGSFAAVAAAAIREVRWADVLLVESPPLFLGLTARWLSAVARRPYVFHVADPWPDYPIEVGALRGRIPIALARWLERVAYAGAAAITTPTRGCAALVRVNAPQQKVHVIPNGVDTERFNPSISVAAARSRLGWASDTFTFVYAGTVGLAQGLGTLLDAAALLESDRPAQRIAIRIVGGGAERTYLQTAARSRGLASVRFDDARPASDVPLLLNAADAILVLLRRGPLSGAAMPTKLVEAMAAGRSIVVSADGDARSLIDDAEAGWTAPAEDARSLANAMARAIDAAGDTLTVKARAVAVSRFDRRVVVAKLRQILEGAAS